MRIELSSRRELDSEGCKSTKNRSKKRQVALGAQFGGLVALGGRFGEPSGVQVCPQELQSDTQEPPSSAQEPPSWVQEAHKRLQVEPKRLQVEPKKRSRGSKGSLERQKCKNIRIELSCRRELDSEGCKSTKNRAKKHQVALRGQFGGHVALGVRLGALKCGPRGAK